MALFTRAPTAADPEGRMSFMEHLGELRTRIVWSLVFVLAGSVGGLAVAERIIDFLSRPVREAGQHLVYTQLTEAFWVQMKVGLVAGIFIAAPGILWQVWRFVEPGLHAHEKKYAVPFIVIGSVLFVIGGAFSLLVVAPFAARYFLTWGRPGLQPMITIGSYFDFYLKFTLAFGTVFELPLAITILARFGIVTAKMLARNRKYAVLGAFIAGAVLTPTPDAFNQTLMAGPLIILYEIGIVCARVFGRRAPAPAPETAAAGTSA